MSSKINAVGATNVASRDLIRMVLGGGASDEEVREADEALALCGAARDAKLRACRRGAKLLAALELGRRAWMLPSPAGRRVRAPVDVAAVVAPRALSATNDVHGSPWVLALDERLTLATAVAMPSLDAAAALRIALSHGTSRLIVAMPRAARAVPSTDDARFVDDLLAAARAVGVKVLDVVILGDDGFTSCLRLGLVPSVDARYR